MTTRHSVVVIIGGGMSGLATAWFLHKAGFNVTVLERDSQVGGTIKTIRENGWLVECGPNSVLETTPLFRQLFTDLGIEEEVEYADEKSNKRYILKEGKLHPLPLTPAAFLGSRLWSFRGKMRLLKEPFVGRGTGEESVAEFVERRLGTEFLDYAVNPFVAGVFAGDPAALSVEAAFPKLYALEKKYGGLIVGQIRGARERKRRAEKAKDRARMFSFKNGMRTLPDAIAKALGDRVQTNIEIHSVLQESDGSSDLPRYRVTGSQKGKSCSFEGSAVIFAIPSYRVSQFIERFDHSLANSLKNIYYPPVAEVFLGFRTTDIHRELDGFGFLVPEKERRRILGTIWSSAIFRNRAPAGHVALTTFVGGSRQPDLTASSDDDLVSVVRQELESIMEVRGAPVYSRIARWEKAIPQYQRGHLSIMRKIEEFEQRYKGLFLKGNYRGGISVGDCVIAAQETVEQVRGLLSGRPAPVSV